MYMRYFFEIENININNIIKFIFSYVQLHIQETQIQRWWTWKNFMLIISGTCSHFLLYNKRALKVVFLKIKSKYSFTIKFINFD